MARIGICIETVFTDLPYSERIRKVAEAGYGGVEFWFHNSQFDGVKLIKKMKDVEAIAGAAQ